MTLTGRNGGSLHDHIQTAGIDKPDPPVLPPMRLFVVHREPITILTDGEIDIADGNVMLHAHSFASDGVGIVHFYEYATEWIDTRWEIVSYCPAIVQSMGRRGRDPQR